MPGESGQGPRPSRGRGDPIGGADSARRGQAPRRERRVGARPSGEGDLRITIDLSSSLKASVVNGNKLVYQATGSEQIQLVYDDLKVWDANGKTLSAHMELNNNGDILSIVVDDKHAVYPVTVDPLNKTPEWTTSADGILPGLLNNLNLQVQTLYGIRLQV